MAFIWYEDIFSHHEDVGRSAHIIVAYFTKKDNSRVVEPPLNFIGGFPKLWLTFLLNKQQECSDIIKRLYSICKCWQLDALFLSLFCIIRGMGLPMPHPLFFPRQGSDFATVTSIVWSWITLTFERRRAAKLRRHLPNMIMMSDKKPVFWLLWKKNWLSWNEAC